jgi:hypothetical protein
VALTDEQRQIIRDALIVNEDGVQVRLKRCQTVLEVEGVMDLLRDCHVPITAETMRAVEQRKKEVRDDRDPHART